MSAEERARQLLKQALQRHAKAYGYFSPERFVGRDAQEAAHELALNPDHFGRTDELIFDPGP